MGYAELIARLKALPQEKQAEVFDFVEFLSRRRRDPDEKFRGEPEWDDAEFAAFAISQALRDEADDPVAYTVADLRERWQ